MIGLPALAVALVLGRCHETSESLAVGVAHCRRFGSTWAAGDGPHFDFSITLGAGWTRLVPDAKATELWLGSGKTGMAINSFAAGALGSTRVDLAALDVRLDAFRWGPLRCGLWLQQGALPVVRTPTASPVGTLVLQGPSATTYGLPLGVDLRFGRVSITADVTPGLSLFSASVSESVSLERYTRFSVVAGGGLRVWLTPAIALEAGASVDLLSLDHVSALVRLHLPVIAAFDAVDSV